MKQKILIIASFIGCILFFYACSLDEESETFRTTDTFYRDQSECQVAVDGMYAAAQWIHKANFFELVELPTDYARTVKIAEQKNSALALYQWTPQHATVLGFYRDAFAAINRFNDVIDNLQQTDFLEEDVKNRMLGEAHFIRGLHYLDLVRVFGELPATVAETESSKVTHYPKWTNEDIFKKVIIPDLTFAETWLPFDAYEAHRASGVAAKALLARTYLWLASCGKNSVMYHEWVSAQGLVQAYTDSVKAKCRAIMDVPKYSLYEHYYDVWLIDNKLSLKSITEHIFSINFEYENGEGLGYGALFVSGDYWTVPAYDLTPGREPVLLGQGYEGMAPSLEFWEEINANIYDRRDTTMFTLRHGNATRKEQFIAAGGPSNPANTTGGSVDMNSGRNFGIVKYRLQKGLETGASGSAAVPIVRYSDVLLMYAEACGRSDADGVAAFEAVRRRAYEKPDYTLAVHNPEDIADDAAWQNAILKERKIELCFETSRWFDLVRTHKLGNTIRSVKMRYNTTGGVQTLDMSLYFDSEEKRMFFPLPSRAIELNDGLEQNAPWK
jgi:hypothetical protein